MCGRVRVRGRVREQELYLAFIKVGEGVWEGEGVWAGEGAGEGEGTGALPGVHQGG